jgi:hypothetical protein
MNNTPHTVVSHKDCEITVEGRKHHAKFSGLATAEQPHSPLFGYAWTDVCQYCGYWQNLVWHGRGILIDSGRCFNGNFAANLREGFGILTEPDGTVFSGVYEGDKREGVFHASFPVGDTFDYFIVEFSHDVEVSRRQLPVGPVVDERFLGTTPRDAGGFQGGDLKITLRGSFGSAVIEFAASDPVWSVIQKLQVVKFPHFLRAMFHCIGWNKDKPQEVQFCMQNKIYYFPFLGGKTLSSFEISCDEAKFVEYSQNGKPIAMPLCAGLRGDPMSYYWLLPVSSPAQTAFEYDVWVAFREEFLKYNKLDPFDREPDEFQQLLEKIVKEEKKSKQKR